MLSHLKKKGKKYACSREELHLGRESGGKGGRMFGRSFEGSQCARLFVKRKTPKHTFLAVHGIFLSFLGLNVHTFAKRS